MTAMLKAFETEDCCMSMLSDLFTQLHVGIMPMLRVYMAIVSTQERLDIMWQLMRG